MRTCRSRRDAEGQKQLLRSLMNVRMPKKIRPEFLQVQDAYLQEVAKEKRRRNACRTRGI